MSYFGTYAGAVNGSWFGDFVQQVVARLSGDPAFVTTLRQELLVITQESRVDVMLRVASQFIRTEASAANVAPIRKKDTGKAITERGAQKLIIPSPRADVFLAPSEIAVLDRIIDTYVFTDVSEMRLFAEIAESYVKTTDKSITT